MPDTPATKLWIGGEIDEDQVGELAEAAEADGATFGNFNDPSSYGHSAMLAWAISEELSEMDAAEVSAPVTFSHDLADNLDNLVRTVKRLGLPAVEFTDRQELGGELRRHNHPRSPEDVPTCAGDHKGRPMVDRAGLADIAEAIEGGDETPLWLDLKKLEMCDPNELPPARLKPAPAPVA